MVFHAPEKLTIHHLLGLIRERRCQDDGVKAPDHRGKLTDAQGLIGPGDRSAAPADNGHAGIERPQQSRQAGPRL